MSNRSKHSGNSVSLFPFLAVLVCAMGALIFLLLVTTRLIREQTVAKTKAGSLTAPESISPPEDAEKPACKSAPLPEPAALPDPWENEPLLPLLAADPAPPPPPPGPTQAELELTAQWQAKVSQLRAAAAHAAESVRAQQASLQRMISDAQTERAGLSELAGRREQLEADQRQLEAAYQRQLQSQINATQEIATLGRKVDEAQRELANASSKFRIIPYDGQSGTVRRPIIIECTETGLTFASEGIALRPSDLDGFTPRINPLRMGTEALVHYWSERQSPGEPEPYVLLVVRPSGTVAYYIARQLLEKLSVPFGYELVTAEAEFDWPETDPQAVEACRTIIERLLRERAQLHAAVRKPTLSGAGEFSGEDGGFHMPEVDRLRRAGEGRQVYINGRTWSREPEMGDAALSRRPSSDGEWTTRDTLAESRSSDPKSGGSESWADPAQSRSSVTNRHERRIRERLTPEHILQPALLPPQRGVAHVAEPPVEGPSASETTPAKTPGVSESLGPSGATQHASEPLGQLDRSRHRALGESADAEFDELLQRTLNPSAAQRPSRPTGGNIGPPAPQRTDRSATIDPAAPQFGIRGPRAHIGLEREVAIRITATRVSVADETTFPIEAGVPAEELRRLLAVHLDAHVRSWGAPPENFYWVPAVRFVVSPGGNQYHKRLEGLIKQWRLPSQVEYVLE